MSERRGVEANPLDRPLPTGTLHLRPSTGYVEVAVGAFDGPAYARLIRDIRSGGQISEINGGPNPRLGPLRVL